MNKINDRTFCMSGNFIVLYKIDGEDSIGVVKDKDGYDVKIYRSYCSAERKGKSFPMKYSWTIREL